MAMKHWTCPFCDRDTVLDTDYSVWWETLKLTTPNADGNRISRMAFTVCPNPKCKKITFEVFLMEAELRDVTDLGGQNPRKEWMPVALLREWRLVPNSRAKVFPDYVPVAIREDYEEACTVLDASPRAAATLARRALQGMIRDFWGVVKPKLYDEIDAIKDKVDVEVWDAMDAVRKVGNIGAQMEKDVNLIIDVEPGEAQKLIGLIEMLIEEWYVHRHQRQEKLAGIKALGDAKDAAKKGGRGGTPPPPSGGKTP